jgi:hypothetical protein
MSRATFSAWTLFIGLVIGMIGSALLYNLNVIGAGYPIMVGLLSAALVGSGVYAGRPLNPRNLWLFIPVLFFAIMIAVRTDGWLSFFNVVLSLGLGALAVHHMALGTPFDLTSTAEQIRDLLATGVRSTVEMPLVTAVRSWGFFFRPTSEDDEQNEDERRGRVVAVLRGLAVTLPVLLVFGLLLGSADAVFATYLPSFAWLENLDIDAFVGRTILAGVIAWVSVGTITYGLARTWREEPDEAAPVEGDRDETVPEGTLPTVDQALRPNKRGITSPFRLSMIEGGMLLGGVNLLFGAFVLVQFVYLFGGQQNIGVEGLSYAEYARRGFFELVTVAVLTMGLVLSADRFVVRDGKGEMRAFRILSVIVIALVGVMLLSAARRMALYTDEFGLTRLRLWTSLFMGWLAVLFAVLVASLYRARRRVFSFGLVLVAIGYFGTLNIINPDARIAAHNIDRALVHGEELDTCYLYYISADAIPVMVERYATSGDERLGELLSVLDAVNNYDRAQGLGAYNAGWTAAGRAMGNVDLTGYTGQYDPYACPFSIYDERY